MKIKSTNPHLPYEELDVSKEEAEKLIKTGNYALIKEKVKKGEDNGTI